MIISNLFSLVQRLAPQLKINFDVQVFEGCPLTTDVSNLLIMKYKMRHNLTRDALADLLKLLQLHLPVPNSLPSSLYHFNKQFASLKDPALTFHYFCSNCMEQLPSKSVTQCPFISCEADLTDKGSISSFIELAVEKQLVAILQSNVIAVMTLL